MKRFSACEADDYIKQNWIINDTTKAYEDLNYLEEFGDDNYLMRNLFTQKNTFENNKLEEGIDLNSNNSSGPRSTKGYLVKLKAKSSKCTFRLNN